MQDKMLNFQEINDHVEANFKGIVDTNALTAASANSKLCGIYKTVRPILRAIAVIPIIPKKWRDAISSFLSVLDVICP